MKTRHKIPAVFSIYMVDVLCCALGCVILLWQLYHHESQEQTAQNVEIRKILADTTLSKDETLAKLAKSRQNLEETLRELLRTQQFKDETLKRLAEANEAQAESLRKLASAHLQMNSLTSEVGALKVTLDASKKKQVQVTLELEDTRKERDKALQLALVRKHEYDAMKKTLASAEAALDALRIDVKSLERKNTLSAAELAEKIREHAGLFDKLAEAEKKIRVLTRDVALKEAETQVAVKRTDDKSNLLKLLEEQLLLARAQSKETQSKLERADDRSRLLERDLERGKKELVDVNRRFAELLNSQEALNQRANLSAKDLEKARQLVALLEQDRLVLVQKAAAAEQRFAGVALTGRRVLFLVDMSGSMELVDENTLEPDKWPIVCETVASIMRSLPDLREFQVILFSDKLRYVFGNDGRWLEYSAEKSPRQVADGLKAIKPKGGTDMYAAFEEAFRFRDKGLDTIYVFSDGLPNMGQGLPASIANIPEGQKADMLAKHVRARLKNVWNRPAADRPRVRINSIGFFFESPDLGAFLWALAREHDGSFVGMSRP